eukprot:TRINITY_DN14305_c0_g1_i1.p2 TRINITY_DN14305_c0_g1~~TRINITY_DN14305_c0_g1_i1.p2  ORF type:complete len:165 (+),score=48.21 TRINITY_DN14305_c0_g1_i1:57-551(+)
MPNITDAAAERLLAQAAVELKASAAYFAFSCWFEERNFPGIASYLRAQSEEERTHGLKFIDFVLKRGGRAFHPSVERQDASEMENAKQIFEAIAEMEQNNTVCIHALVDKALEEKDHATHAFLLPFVEEQVNAEDESQLNLAKVRAYAALPGLLYHLDYELGKK